MIVVADTSPLNYLVQMGRELILREVYGSLILPPAVAAELIHEGAPEAVRAWARDLPDWVTVPHVVALDGTLPAVLGRGETEAISLALEMNATFILLDDHEARTAAKRRRLVPAGTIAILIQASERGLLDIKSAIADLKALGFRMSIELEERALSVDGDSEWAKG